MIKTYLKRLFPAANATALTATALHVFGIGLLSGLSFELIYIAILTYILAMIVGLLFGVVLLLLVSLLKLGPLLSLLLFFLVAQFAIMGLSMMFFESEFGDLIGVYHLISIPPIIVAWYYSVAYVWKKKI